MIVIIFFIFSFTLRSIYLFSCPLKLCYCSLSSCPPFNCVLIFVTTLNDERHNLITPRITVMHLISFITFAAIHYSLCTKGNCSHFCISLFHSTSSSSSFLIVSLLKLLIFLPQRFRFSSPSSQHSRIMTCKNRKREKIIIFRHLSS